MLPTRQQMLGGGALANAKPKRGLFERINDEALTKNSPSVQFGK